MRVHRSIPVLAAAITLAGGSAPAYALDAEASPAAAGGQPTAIVAHHPTGSIDWLIGIATAGGIAVLGTGLAANRRVRRSASAPSDGVRVPSQS